jgi:hypothetical protein
MSLTMDFLVPSLLLVVVAFNLHIHLSVLAWTSALPQIALIGASPIEVHFFRSGWCWWRGRFLLPAGPRLLAICRLAWILPAPSLPSRWPPSPSSHHLLPLLVGSLTIRRWQSAVPGRRRLSASSWPPPASSLLVRPPAEPPPGFPDRGRPPDQLWLLSSRSCCPRRRINTPPIICHISMISYALNCIVIS